MERSEATVGAASGSVKPDVLEVPRVLRTGKPEEGGGNGDGFLAALSLAILVAGMLVVSYVVFSI